MSTAFPFTIPRRLALSTGLRLIQWARRPATASEARSHVLVQRREARLRSRVRQNSLAEQRERDVVRYLSHVRPFV